MNDRRPRPEALAKIFDAARSSSLEEALWGLVFPDYIRTIAAPFKQSAWVRKNRAWAIERAWLRHNEPVHAAANPGVTNLPATTWTNWIKRTASGHLPAVVFNTTVVETGEQLLISTVNFPSPDPQGAAFGVEDVPIQTLQELYGNPQVVDIDAVSAARLSATFPLITPTARARYHALEREQHGHPPSYHIVDGGFFDNPGIVSAVEWLRRILPAASSTRHVQILFIRISAFPNTMKYEPFDSLEWPAGKGQGAITSGAWPVQVLANMRTASQVARSELEIELLKASLPKNIAWTEVEFRPSAYPDTYRPPLSWQLGPMDEHYLRARLGQGIQPGLQKSDRSDRKSFSASGESRECPSRTCRPPGLSSNP